MHALLPLLLACFPREEGAPVVAEPESDADTDADVDADTDADTDADADADVDTADTAEPKDTGDTGKEEDTGPLDPPLCAEPWGAITSTHEPLYKKGAWIYADNRNALGGVLGGEADLCSWSCDVGWASVLLDRDDGDPYCGDRDIELPYRFKADKELYPVTLCFIFDAPPGVATGTTATCSLETSDRTLTITATVMDL